MTREVKYTPSPLAGLGREERVLRQALQGYDDYASRVRFRLLPGVW